MVSLKDFAVANKGGVLVQDDEIDLNHDGDSLTLGLGTYKELTYHVIVKAKTTSVFGSSGTTTEIDEDRKLTKGQVTITNSETVGTIGVDRNTKVLLVKATDAVGTVVKASPEAAKAIAGSRDAERKAWWNKWWWVVLIVVVVVGVVSAWVLVSYFRRAAPAAPVVAVTAPSLPSPTVLPGPPGVG